jgi:hypothetical protein
LSTLHIHIDESGNLTFSRRGSRYYIFAATWTFDPEPLAQEITRLRFSLLRDGVNIESSHATLDRQRTRDLFVRTISSSKDWKFAATVVDKRKVHPSIRNEARFYPQFLNYLLRFILRGSVGRRATALMIYTDTLPVRAQREAVEKSIKLSCSLEITGKPFRIYHHREEGNNWIQVADYCSWSVFRKWEGGDQRTYDQLVSHLEVPELDVLQRGIDFYY